MIIYFLVLTLRYFKVALREAHEQAVQKAMAAFNRDAVGGGAAKKKYEGFLQKFFKKAFEVLDI